MSRISGNQIIALLVIGVILYWGLFLGGFSLLVRPPGEDVVQLRVQTNDAITEAVFSPAGASVKVWDAATHDYLGALSEDTTHDGKWDSAFHVQVGSKILVKVADSGNTFYTNIVERTVPPGASGIERIGVLEPIGVYPRSATSKSDLVGTLMTAGAEVDNSTGIASGETEILVMLTAASAKAWGGNAYYDPETGDQYIGAFIVFDLTTTTARATIEGANLWNHFSVGSHEYWIFTVPMVINDDDITTDGTYSFTVEFNNLVAAAAALDIGAYVNAVDTDVLATSFGTDDANGHGEDWQNIALS